MSCPFATLGLSRNATKDEVRQAYHELARKYHPDKGRSSSGERMKVINAAYEEALRVLDTKHGHMAYQNLDPGYEASKSGYDTYQTSKSGYGTYKAAQPTYTIYQASKSGRGTYKTTQPGYTTYSTSKPGHSTYATAQPTYTTYKTTNSSYGAYKDSEPSSATYQATGSRYSSSAYGSSKARDNLQFSEFGGSRSRHQESSRGGRRTESSIPEWVHRRGRARRMCVEAAERELQALRYGSGGRDLDFLTRNLERARRDLRRHEEWVEEGLEHGYDFNEVKHD